MVSQIVSARAWLAGCRLARAWREWDDRRLDRLMIKIGQRRPDILSKYVMAQATEISTSVAMAMLDREGLRHCFRCPQRFGLRKGGKGFACPIHSEEVKAAVAA